MTTNLNYAWVKENYDLYNAIYFNYELPDITISISYRKVTSTYAYCKNLFPDTYLMVMNFYHDCSEDMWRNVLLHEMIHIWQYVKFGKGGHGKTFKQKAAEINKSGCDVQTKYNY